MEIKLEPLTLGSLTDLETCELAQRFLAQFESIPPASPKTDVSILNRSVGNLTTCSTAYFKSIVKVQGSSITHELAMADKVRDTAIKTFRKALKLGALSLNSSQVKAAHHLQVLLHEYKGIERLNYEAETMAIDKLVSELEGSNYASQVELLNLQMYVNHIKESGLSFKTLSHQRLSVEAQKEVFDTRQLRSQLMKEFKEMCLYVMVMASVTSDPYFINVLTRINAIRKQYADIVAHRKGVATARKAVAKPSRNNFV